MDIDYYNEDFFMNEALKEAQKAVEMDEIPVGAVVVHRNKIIGRGHNQTERLHDPTAHAEMIAITSACHYLQSKYLEDCALYITLEPCVMCAGAIQASRVSKMYFGASEPKMGFTLLVPSLTFTHTEIISGVLASKSADLLTSFFRNKRKKLRS
jgi:tRNA(adenine34) deaminase